MQFWCRSLSWERWNWANSPRDALDALDALARFPKASNFQDLRASYREVLEEPRPHDVGGHFGEDSSLLLPFLVLVVLVPSSRRCQAVIQAISWYTTRARERESHFNEIKHHLQLFIQTDHQCHSQTRCERATRGGLFWLATVTQGPRWAGVSMRWEGTLINRARSLPLSLSRCLNVRDLEEGSAPTPVLLIQCEFCLWHGVMNVQALCLNGEWRLGTAKRISDLN